MTDTANTVDVSKLKVGMVVKNYKEMCGLFGVDVVGGNTKIAQHKLWRRYFDWERSGHKYIIKNIYDTPLPKQVRPDNVFVQYIEEQLIVALAHKEDGTYYFTDNLLYTTLGMVSREYIKLQHYESFVQELTNPQNEISQHGMWVLCRQAKAKLRRILDNVLESMQQRGLISYRRENAVKRSETGEYMSATKEEDTKILEVKNSILKEFGYSSLMSVVNSKDSAKFFRRVNECLKDKYGIYGTFSRIRVVYNRPYYLYETVGVVIDQYKEMEERYYENKKALNNAIVESFKTMIKESNERSKKIICERVYKKGNGDREHWDLNEIKSSTQYLFDGEQFIEKYIKNGYKEVYLNDWIFWQEEENV